MDPPGKRRKLNPSVKTPTDREIREIDLPLLANVNDVKITHYLLKLTPDFEKKTAKGTLIVFLEWLKIPFNNADAEIILDACFLNVKEVSSLKRKRDYDPAKYLSEWNGGTGRRKHFYKSSKNTDWFAKNDETEETLIFSVEKWFVTISGWQRLPSVIRIDYETMEGSPSLHWTPCSGHIYGEKSGNSSSDNSNKCVFTPAAAVNNRGLLPCQEPPSALATWEVLLEVDKNFTPLLTSDEAGEIVSLGERVNIHYFYTSVLLPISTFALVIGQFSVQTSLSPPERYVKRGDSGESLNVMMENVCINHPPHPCRLNNPVLRLEKVVPVRLFSLDPDCLISLDLSRFSNFVYHSLKTCFDNFGPHPFGRLDLVVMPKWFPYEGLANPSMIFLSPSNFFGTVEPMFLTRIPHEICHSWFGLLIGSLDWTEEWLSEGFSTFCEDVVFKETYKSYFPNKSEEEISNELAVKKCLRFIFLQSEMVNTDKDLQVMSRASENDQAAKNGLDPMKQCMHVHAYKGYFLLWHLAFLVEEKNFLEFLKEYIWKHHGQLVTSDMFLDCYYEKFKAGYGLCATEKATFIQKFRGAWLESESLPSPFDFNATQFIKTRIRILRRLPLFRDAVKSIKKVRKVYDDLKAEIIELDELQRLTTSELRILFHLVLSEEEDKSTMKTLNNQLLNCPLFDKGQQNPDVMHHWCELIISCNDQSRIPMVKSFLENNLSMGVYLYGELMISRKPKFKKFAISLFLELEQMYSVDVRRNLREMLLPA